MRREASASAAPEHNESEREDVGARAGAWAKVGSMGRLVIRPNALCVAKANAGAAVGVWLKAL